VNQTCTVKLVQSDFVTNVSGANSLLVSQTHTTQPVFHKSLNE